MATEIQTFQYPESFPARTPKAPTSTHHLPSITRGQAHDGEFYVCDVIQNVLFCVWPFFLANIVSLRFTHMLGCVTFHCVKVPCFSSNSAVGGDLRCFQHRAITACTAMDILE